MENRRNLPAVNSPSGTGLQISERAKEIVKVVVHVNMLLQYPLDGESVKMWAQSIDELHPGLNLAKLKFMMDCFKTEEIEWDKSKGIQNIFYGLNQIVELEDGKFKVRKYYL